jgi:hypothetical protein
MRKAPFIQPRQVRVEEPKAPKKPALDLGGVPSGSPYWDGPHFTARKLYSPASQDDDRRDSVTPIS